MWAVIESTVMIRSRFFITACRAAGLTQDALDTQPCRRSDEFGGARAELQGVARPDEADRDIAGALVSLVAIIRCVTTFGRLTAKVLTEPEPFAPRNLVIRVHPEIRHTIRRDGDVRGSTSPAIAPVGDARRISAMARLSRRP